MNLRSGVIAASSAALISALAPASALACEPQHVPEGGSSALYLLLAGLALGAAIFVKSRRASQSA